MVMPPSDAAADPIEVGGELNPTVDTHISATGTIELNLQKVSGWFIAVYTITMFGVNLVMLAPMLFGLAYKIQVIDPEAKEASLGLVVGIGALFNIVFTPLLGVLSDRTRLRWGRRRPWFALGILLIGASGFAIAVAPTVPLVLVGWVVYIIGLAAILAAVAPVIAERVPVSQRGKVGALSGVSTQLGGVAGTLIGSMLTGSLVLLFLLPVGLLAALSLLYFAVIPDRPARDDEREPISNVFRNMVFNPRKHSDFAWVWLGRFLLQVGMTFFSTYQLYFLLDRLGFTPESAGQKLALVGGIGILVTMAFAIVGGILSDRLKRRKIFIYLASAAAAAGLVTAAFAESFEIYFVATVLILAGAGLFGSVDLAMAGDVVPDKTKSGRWMSILNVSGYVPSAIAPIVAPLILMTGEGSNYTALFLTGALVATGAAITTWRVRGVR